MQRVSIGRAIVRKPRVFLMDEPLSALDAKLREALRTELKNMQMNLGADLPVRHPRPDRGDVDGRQDRRAQPRPSGPDRHAARDLQQSARTPSSRASVGSPPMNLLDGRLVAGRAVDGADEFRAALCGRGSGGNADGRPLIFGIRPEDVCSRPARRSRRRVHDVENHGVEKILTLRVGDAMLRATVPAQHRPRHRGGRALLLEPGKGRAVRPGHRRKPQARRLSVSR